MLSLLMAGALIGIGATIAMDLWAIVLNRAFAIPTPNWGAVGRWVWHLQSGTLFHDDIATAPSAPSEAAPASRSIASTCVFGW